MHICGFLWHTYADTIELLQQLVCMRVKIVVCIQNVKIHIHLHEIKPQYYVTAYTNCDIQLQNVAHGDGLKSPKHVEHLMINKDTL